jgi:hypothetical protein
MDTDETQIIPNFEFVKICAHLWQKTILASGSLLLYPLSHVRNDRPTTDDRRRETHALAEVSLTFPHCKNGSAS